MDRSKALELLLKYNSQEFLLRHALTVEGVMRYFASTLGYENEIEYWGIVGLLHDLDYEKYPTEHCVKTKEIMLEEGVPESIINSAISHGYGMTKANVKPEHIMEKVLYAIDELTGLIGAVAILRPSKSTKDLELKSVKKKYKVPTFAAGCKRDVIGKGAENLGWELDELIEKTIIAMREYEDKINEELNTLNK